QEIFEKHGEAHFRKLELQALRQLAKGRGRVIALGGGTPTQDEAWKYLRNSGITIYLKRSPEQLLYNLRDDTQRPLLKQAPPENPLLFIRQLLAAREPFYLQADLVLDCADGWTKEETFHHLLCLLEGKL
ncbi:MAG: shikimate kinase, partial [Calditrichaeota bacterium]